MVLSDKKIEEHVIKEKDIDKIKQIKEWWETGDWHRIGNKIFIEPFKPENVELCGYGFSVGVEYVLLKDPYTKIKLNKGDNLDLGPDETALILTEEYVCLPREIMGLVVSRGRWIFEGASVSAARIEPSWYGKLIIAFTNHTKFPLRLAYGAKFCTCYFMEVPGVEKTLTKRETSFLGRTEIDVTEVSHLTQRELVTPEKVTMEDLDNVVKSFGRPWDVVVSGIHKMKDIIIDYIEKEFEPRVIDETCKQAVQEFSKKQEKWIKVLIGALISILVAFIALIGGLIYVLLRK